MTAIYKVFTQGGKHVFTDSQFCIHYLTDNAGEASVSVWGENCDSSFSLSILNSPSGSGKTTFISNVYRYVQNQDSTLRFDFQPDHASHEQCAYGYIPQHPPFGDHWRIKDILPSHSNYLSVFFPEGNEADFQTKRLGQFSGGQKMKLYFCSAVERLHLTARLAAFLILDEVLDGLGAQEAQRCIRSLRQSWTSLASAPIYILLVSHLDKDQMLPDDLPVTHLSLAVTDESEGKLSVKIRNG